MSWVLRHSEETLGRRLVLLALADSAEEDGGNAWPSVATLCGKTRLSERQVQYALRGLEKDGAIVNEGRHRTSTQRYGTNVYRVVMGAETAPFDESKGAIHDNGRVQPTAPDPSLEQPSSVSVANAPDTHGPRTVGRRPVTQHEHRLSLDVLADWNELTGQELRSVDWLVKIIGRIREYPEATRADHRYVIERNLAHPWWTGPPTPSVVYGSGAQFERAVMTARQAEGDADRIERIVNAVMDRRQQ